MLGFIKHGKTKYDLSVCGLPYDAYPANEFCKQWLNMH